MRAHGWLAVIVMAPLSVATQAADDFRLAGTMSYGDGKWLAMVEVRSGQQQLVRANDSLGGGTVVEISDRVVRVRFPEGDRIYVLEGGRTVATWVAPSVPDGSPIIASRVIGSDFLDSLGQVEQRFNKSDPATLHNELNRLLGVPPSARIRSVNQAKTQSDTQVIAAVRNNVRSRFAVHLFLEDSPSLTEVYLLPAQNAAAAMVK